MILINVDKLLKFKAKDADQHNLIFIYWGQLSYKATADQDYLAVCRLVLDTNRRAKCRIVDRTIEGNNKIYHVIITPEKAKRHLKKHQ